MKKNKVAEAKKPRLKLSGGDGNIFMIIGAARRAARKAGWDDPKIEAFCAAVTATPNYDSALQTVMENFDVE